MYYMGICSERGKRVEEDDAFEYALKETRKSKEVQADFVRCFGEEFDKIRLTEEETKQEFVEWFFSGNWLERDEESD